MMTVAAPTFLLVDGSSYLYRAFHALPPLTNAEGQPTGAIYGVVNMLRRQLRELEPSYVAVVFDPRGETHRHSIYADYKATRLAMPDDLSIQVPILHELIEAMGLPLIIVDRQEADDVIGTLAKLATAKGWHSIISTGDKDLAQLVNDQVTLVNTMSNTSMDIAGVEEKFGVPPEQIIDYLALIGDTSDNIPGIAKVGPKTAQKWLASYGSLDGVVANAAAIGGKVGENLRATLDQLPLYRELVTINVDLPLTNQLEDLCLGEPDIAKQREMFKRLGFNAWLKALPAEEMVAQGSLFAVPATDVPAATQKSSYQLITTMAAWQDYFAQLKAAEVFVLDAETTSLNVLHAELVGVALCCEVGQAVYVPLAHQYEGVGAQCDQSQVLADLAQLLQDPNKTLVGHNLKYDLGVLANLDIQPSCCLVDTMLMSYVLDSARNRHDLSSLAQGLLDHTMIGFEEALGDAETFAQVPLVKAVSYAAEDADITWQLYELFAEQLQTVPSLQKILAEIECRLVPVLSRMERAGVLIDSQALAAQSAALAERIATYEQQAHQLIGEDFNLASPKQLQAILFEQLNLPIKVKTPKGQPSTSEEALHALVDEHPLPALILGYRSLSKLKSTYTDKLPQEVDSQTGRVHCSYNQAVTATGRLSSAHPNLQNIPVRSEEGRLIRQAFVAAPGCQLVAADYSQIELRIMAHLSEDAGLLQAFADEQDVHKATAAEVFGVALAEVSDEMRRHAKAINFGLMYGMSAFGLAKQLGVARGEAQAYIDRYFERYPGVQRYMTDIRAQAAEQGYVETLIGRRLYLSGINDRNHARRAAAERAAINAPMQGSSADIIKLAMIEIDRYLQGSAAKMIMQVHDELVFEVPVGEVESLVAAIVPHMEQALQLKVPLKVDVGIGANWSQAH